MSQTQDWAEIPRLEGWVTLDQAAEILGLSCHAVHQRAGRGCFQTLRTIGGILIVREAEVREQAVRRRRLAEFCSRQGDGA